MAEDATIDILYKGSPALEQTENGDWIDLYINEDVTMQAGDFKIIPLGIACKLPDGYEAIIAPRSSTFKRYGILEANGIGIVDASYCSDNDEWGFPAYATRPVVLERGTRICQFRIQKNQPQITFNKVSHLGGKARGGFGSTGI